MSQELGSLWLSERGEHSCRLVHYCLLLVGSIAACQKCSQHACHHYQLLEGMVRQRLACEVAAASAPAEGKSKLPESRVGWCSTRCLLQLHLLLAPCPGLTEYKYICPAIQMTPLT